MARKRASRRSLRSALRSRAAKQAARTKANNAELRRIEKALGEEFESLKQARQALKDETESISKEPKTLKEYLALYDATEFESRKTIGKKIKGKRPRRYDDYYEDQGEVEGGVDY